MARERSSEELKALFEGVSLSVLGQLFDMDKREVTKKLTEAGVEASGKREGYSVYPIGEAARALVGAPQDLGQLLASLKPKDFPPHLQGAFWEGQMKRLKFEEMRGDLWRTQKVHDVFLETFRSFRTALLLFQDKVEAQTSLTEEQREIINGLSDDALNAVQTALVEQFDLYDGSNDHPETGVKDGV